ncbi:MAG: tyrosine-type recombinase/integrase [Sphingomonas sp.]|uniref:tyrosine-type recombinase/integrase n=1 Tax=Sphingomonas sp. TaxID=28214 RepID=UPI001AC43F28|nr:tyrosine-type recombinase/integrase [Sphingomonas sp.]MBN8806648.1 tyrosine-type recombinase/integrase [Sphingomonas sp.]
MARSKLTKTVVDALEPRDKDYVEWCGKLSGFGCRVRPSGRKVFIIQYRIGGVGTVRKQNIGKYGPGGLTVDEAWDRGDKLLRVARDGIDPAAAEKKKKAELTVAELCDEYIERGCGNKRASTVDTDKAALDNHVKPLLGSKKISDVTDADFKAFMRDVEKGKTATTIVTKKGERPGVRGGAGVARRTARVLSGVFTYAVGEKYLEKNPRGTVKIAKDNENERYLSADEIDRLGATMHEAEHAGLPWALREGAKAKHRAKDADTRRAPKMSPHAIAAIRLLLATGMRSGEVLTLKWEFYDAENGFLYLPVTKTKKRVVVLSDFAREILDTLRKTATKGHPYVIEGEGENEHRTDLKRPWAQIIAHAGLGKVRLHDIRHTFASHAALDGISLSVVGKLLGHSQTATTARYTHFAETALRAAANRVATPLSDKIARQSNVVPLKAAS